MDSVVIKYLLWALFSYGLQVSFAVAQVLLCAYLVANGVLQLSSKDQLSKWNGRFGLTLRPQSQKSPLLGGLMLVAGIALIVPFITGASYWIVVVASFAAFILLLYLAKAMAAQGLRVGRLARSGLTLFAVLVFGLTLWEGGDLIGMAKSVATKAKYWRDKEVAGWQAENNPNAPKVGEMAPDFLLTSQSGAESVQLSALRGKKPVVLIFGSFT
ncbi:MAG: hypothetical protein OET90_03965 [Desulfuromonadales bacterium]|nr:hypothetical protein [Desulfuromonadales bacterium]